MPWRAVTPFSKLDQHPAFRPFSAVKYLRGLLSYGHLCRHRRAGGLSILTPAFFVHVFIRWPWPHLKVSQRAAGSALSQPALLLRLHSCCDPLLAVVSQVIEELHFHSGWPLIPSLGYPGEGNGNPVQYSCLEKPVDGGAW